MAHPHISILTRTSGRPRGFARTVESINAQTYPHLTHIVGYDTKKDLRYIKETHSRKKRRCVEVPRTLLKYLYPSENPRPNRFALCIHNLYFNHLHGYVPEGFIIYLDDDDYLTTPTAIEEIVSHIPNKDTLIIWRFRVMNLELPPLDFAEPKHTKIGGSCFTFHTKWLPAATWDQWKCSDYRVIKSLWESIPEYIYIPKIFVHAPQQGHGKRNDIT